MICFFYFYFLSLDIPCNLDGTVQAVTGSRLCCHAQDSRQYSLFFAFRLSFCGCCCGAILLCHLIFLLPFKTTELNFRT